MGVVEQLHYEMQNRFGGDPVPEIGCFRRNVWTVGELSWKLKASNMLLDSIGTPGRVRSVTGSEHVVYFRENRSLQFRGGPWRDHWREDIDKLSALVRTQYPIVGTILLWENEGEVSINELPLPEAWEQIAEELQAEEWTDDHPPRLRKDLARASACWYCPTKARCDATDRLHGECGDWPAGYTAGPPRG
jgi:hypothetical protein